MSQANLVGGSQRDREQLLKLHADYIDANARFDRQKLDPIWSKAPEAVFFNLNGHTYEGRDHWFKLWEFYGKNVQSSYWTPFDVGGVVSDDMAVIWCHRHSQRNWVGTVAAPPRDIHYQGQDFVSRSTMVFHKENGQWQPLREGMTLTVEPGCYIRPAAGVPEQFWNIGVRIEDDVLVTGDGCEVLTGRAPKDPAEIEALMRR